MQTYNKYKMEKAETINATIKALPVATEKEFSVEGADKNRYKAIVVNGEVVSVPRKTYNLIQHNEAFRPIIEGITLAGIRKFNYVIWYNNSQAELQLYLENDVYDSVSVGFTVSNSFDYSKAINYGFKMDKRSHSLELVGYRQVCSNGMKIRVPLNEAEFVRPEIRTKIEVLFEKGVQVRHTMSAKGKIEEMKNYAEALALLKEPVKIMIQKAQNFELKNKTLIEKIVELHIGKRLKKAVIEQFAKESQDLWGLYNAVTYIASHNEAMNDFSREKLKDKASDMLYKELVVEVPN